MKVFLTPFFSTTCSEARRNIPVCESGLKVIATEEPLSGGFFFAESIANEAV